MYDVHNPPMMACGHAANALTTDGHPSCAICVGIHLGATVVADEKPSLEGRTASCSYCRDTVPSKWGLPFFSYRADSSTDLFYCGCRGWD